GASPTPVLSSAYVRIGPWYGLCPWLLVEGRAMARCEVCGNEYDKSFEVVSAGKTHVFDSFECAIHALAPRCAHCGCRIIGHGSEAGGDMYCSAHCAKAEGVRGVGDRAPAPGDPSVAPRANA